LFKGNKAAPQKEASLGASRHVVVPGLAQKNRKQKMLLSGGRKKDPT